MTFWDSLNVGVGVVLIVAGVCSVVRLPNATTRLDMVLMLASSVFWIAIGVWDLSDVVGWKP